MRIVINFVINPGDDVQIGRELVSYDSVKLSRTIGSSAWTRAIGGATYVGFIFCAKAIPADLCDRCYVHSKCLITRCPIAVGLRKDFIGGIRAGVTIAWNSTPRRGGTSLRSQLMLLEKCPRGQLFGPDGIHDRLARGHLADIHAHDANGHNRQDNGQDDNGY